MLNKFEYAQNKMDIAADPNSNLTDNERVEMQLEAVEELHNSLLSDYGLWKEKCVEFEADFEDSLEFYTQAESKFQNEMPYYMDLVNNPNIVTDPDQMKILMAELEERRDLLDQLKEQSEIELDNLMELKAQEPQIKRLIASYELAIKEIKGKLDQ